MQRVRNITDFELANFNAMRDWDRHKAQILTLGQELLWVHSRRIKFTSLHSNDARLIRRVKILKIDNFDITTDFGKYSMENGRNIHEACGCMRFCDCYGRLFLPLEELS